MTCPYCGHNEEPGQTVPETMHITACSRCLNAFVCVPGGGTEPVAGEQDVRERASDGSVARNMLNHSGQLLDNLPTLPSVPAQIMTLIHDPIASMSEIAALIKRDPALTTSVLRLANSASSGASQRITDVNTACSRLGLKHLGQLVSAVTFHGLFQSRHPIIIERMRILWEHSLATGLCANNLAHLAPDCREAPMFLGGLLHDIGKVILLQLIEAPDLGSTERVRESPDAIEQLLAQFGPLLGLHLARHYDLPQEIRVAIYLSPSPEGKIPDAWQSLAYAIALADALTATAGFSDYPEGKAPEIAPLASYFGMGTARIEELTERSQKELAVLMNAAAA